MELASMKIGSGDTGNLLMGTDTHGFQSLLQRFVSGEVPYYNALASPINQLRTGVILEKAYFQQFLPDNYYPQVKCYSPDFDILLCTLDFATMENRKVLDFDELKTMWLTDFIGVNLFRDSEPEEYLAYLKKSQSKYYNQVQQQLLVTGLESCNLVFLAVTSYNDEVNYNREIKPNEVIKFRIFRDEDVIERIKERVTFFQNIKKYITDERNFSTRKRKGSAVKE